MSNGQHQVQGQTNTANQGGYDFLLRKSEKLTTALYMVTDIMSEKEPLKWKVRESGVEVLSDVTLSSMASSSERITMLRNVMKKIERVVSFLDIALSAKMLSEMNVSVLKREYISLKESVEAEWSRIQGAGKPMWNAGFFDVPMLPPSTAERQVEQQKKDIPANTNPVTREERPAVIPPRNDRPAAPANATQTHTPFARAFEKEKAEGEQPRPAFVREAQTPRPAQERETFSAPRRENASETAQQFRAPAPTVASFSRAPEANRDDRRKIILALLKQKQFLNVNDVAKSLPDVSEKTIQRELLAMVAEGTLIKKGERRWSTYSLRQAQMGL